MLRMFLCFVAALSILVGSSAVEAQDKIKGKVEKTTQGKIEVLTVTVELSDKEKEAFLKDHAGFMKKFFEEQGFKVNRYVVTPEAAARTKKLIRDSAKGAPVALMPRVVHVIAPPEEASTYI